MSSCAGATKYGVIIIIVAAGSGYVWWKVMVLDYCSLCVLNLYYIKQDGLQFIVIIVRHVIYYNSVPSLLEYL